MELQLLRLAGGLANTQKLQRQYLKAMTLHRAGA
jgi:hypothetical protein